MAFFSKLKKAKGAADEHKKAAAAQEQAKPKVPYKHVPTHAAQDALAAAPTAVGAADLRARIAEARKNCTSPPPSITRSRSFHTAASSRPGSSSSSANITPSHSRASSFGGRSNSDLSIGSVMMEGRDQQPSQRDYFSQPYKPTVSSSPSYRARGKNNRPPIPTSSSRSSMKAKRRSPLATVSINEEDESEPSSGESPVSDRSVASSQSSATDISRPSSRSEEAPYMVAVPPLPPCQDEKYDSAVEAEPAPKATSGIKRRKSVWSVFRR